VRPSAIFLGCLVADIELHRGKEIKLHVQGVVAVDPRHARTMPELLISIFLDDVHDFGFAYAPFKVTTLSVGH